jgi:hypothetical protein
MIHAEAQRRRENFAVDQFARNEWAAQKLSWPVKAGHTADASQKPQRADQHNPGGPAVLAMPIQGYRSTPGARRAPMLFAHATLQITRRLCGSAPLRDAFLIANTPPEPDAKAPRNRVNLFF